MGKYTFTWITTVLIIFYYEKQRIDHLDYVYPEVGYSIQEYVDYIGYKFENHTVVSDDGYILEIHRIPSFNPNPKLLPIFLMHGFSCSSMTWLLASKSLPVYLAERGYDVWLGNARGNFYSRKHVKIDPDLRPDQFFNFSWHEIGSIDVPAMIDYVLEETKHEKVYYAGHSQGSLVFYVMMSERPEYNKKVEAMIALAPVVYTQGVKSILFRLVSLIQGFSEWITPLLGIYEMTPRESFMSSAYNAYCYDGAWLQNYCDLPVSLAGGFNKIGINVSAFPFVFTHFPDGASTKQLFHYTQTGNANALQHYDYGPKRNLLKYGQINPPLYYLNRTTVPVNIFWGYNDDLTSAKLIERLEEELPNVKMNYKIRRDYFSHFDFMVSLHSEDLYYHEFMDVIEENSCRNTSLII